MKKIFLAIIFVSTVCIQAAATVPGHNDKQTKTPKKHIVLGERIHKDTTNITKLSLKSHLIIPKGDWQIGMAASYMNLSTNDSEFLLLLNDTYSSAAAFRISLHGAYSYMRNQSLGLRIQYSNGACSVDASTLDLLGNFSLDLKDVKAKTNSYSAYLYNRSYVGLDYRGRVGFFLEAALGYSNSRSNISVGSPSNAYTLNNKVSALFSPGIIFFPMNNVSLSASLNLAELSYNHSTGYENNHVTGDRKYFKAQAKLNLLALNFGITVHL